MVGIVEVLKWRQFSAVSRFYLQEISQTSSLSICTSTRICKHSTAHTHTHTHHKHASLLGKRGATQHHTTPYNKPHHNTQTQIPHTHTHTHTHTNTHTPKSRRCHTTPYLTRHHTTLLEHILQPSYHMFLFSCFGTLHIYWYKWNVQSVMWKEGFGHWETNMDHWYHKRK